jgi:uncharacterized coiled-coil protein SlyX
MIVDQWETGLTEAEVPALEPGPRRNGTPGPVGQLPGQQVLDAAVRSLQEDLASLQAQQERGISSLGGALEHLGQELSLVRTQLAALAEPLLAAQSAPTQDSQSLSPEERERVENRQRLERLERQVALLMRGLDSVESLRYQSDVHTRALARLTDLLGEVVKPKPVEGLAALQLAVASLAEGQRRASRLQTISLALLGIGLTPGIGALAWLLLRTHGL